MSPAARMFMEGGGGAGAYVQDGLLAMWSGVENAGPGVHDASAAVWANLGSLGSAYDAPRYAGAVKWRDDCAVFDDETHPYCFVVPRGLMSRHMRGEWTVEVVAAPAAGFYSNYSGIAGQHAYNDRRSQGLIFFQYENGRTSCAVYRGSDACDVLMHAATVLPAGMRTTMSVAGSASAVSFECYRNGARFDESSPGFVGRVRPSSANDVTLSDGQKFCIGAAIGSGYDADRCFHGTISCVRVYGRALSADEVAANRAVDVACFGEEETA